MTIHIKERIENILFSGGIIVDKLKKFVDILEDIRSVESINREFKESFAEIESKKGTIMQSTKDEVFKYINNVNKYKNEYI